VRIVDVTKAATPIASSFVQPSPACRTECLDARESCYMFYVDRDVTHWAAEGPT